MKPSELEENYSGVTLAAWRSRASQVLQVDIGVAATKFSNTTAVAQATFPDEVQAADVLVLKLKNGEASAWDEWAISHPKEKSPPYRHVVLMEGETVLAVATVQDTA